MDQIASWFTTYSPPAALLLIVGAAIIFVLRLTVERAIDGRFEQQNRILALALERRSRFEEKILLDRYQKVCELQTRFSRIMLDLRRHFHGAEVNDLFAGNEVVPLTALFQDIADSRYLLTETFHGVLYREALLALDFANSKGDVNRFSQRQMELQTEFRTAMNRVFGIDRIAYDVDGGARERQTSAAAGSRPTLLEDGDRAR